MIDRILEIIQGVLRLVESDDGDSVHGTATPPVGDPKSSYFTSADRKDTADIHDRYIALRAKFGDEFYQLVRRLEDGEISRSDFEIEAKALIQAAYDKAYAAGKKITADEFQIRGRDISRVDHAATDEMGYVKDFGDAVADGTGKMPADQRAGMYTKALDGVYLEGQVAGMPPGARIWWRLGVAEHCADCLDLHAKSPYTPVTLPTVPRKCDTVCLSNCKCFLEIEVIDSGPEEPSADNVKPEPAQPHQHQPTDAPTHDIPKPDVYVAPADVKAADVPSVNEDGDPVPASVARQINDLRAEMNYWVQRIEIETDKEKLKELFHNRAEANDKLIDIEAAHKVYSRPTVSVSELQHRVADVAPSDLILRASQLQGRTSDPVAIVRGASVYRGRVVSSGGGVVRVETLEGHIVDVVPGEPPYILVAGDGVDLLDVGDGAIVDPFAISG